jgi:hypothetical protein
VPVRLTLSGLSAALSVIWTDAVRLPDADGENVTEMVQVALTATAAGQLSLSAKSPAFVPDTAMLEMASDAVPELVSVTVFALLVDPFSCEPKLRLEGESDTAGAGVVPVPPRVTVCGLLAALSVIWTLAERLPAAVGENVTEMLHVPFTAREAGQVLV